jgi:hypothetical protein
MAITRKYITRKRQFEQIMQKIVSGLKDRNRDESKKWRELGMNVYLILVWNFCLFCKCVDIWVYQTSPPILGPPLYSRCFGF